MGIKWLYDTHWSALTLGINRKAASNNLHLIRRRQNSNIRRIDIRKYPECYVTGLEKRLIFRAFQVDLCVRQNIYLFCFFF